MPAKGSRKKGSRKKSASNTPAAQKTAAKLNDSTGPALNVPAVWADKLGEEAAVLRQDIADKLETCVALNDHGKGAKYFMQQLDRYMRSKLPLTPDDRVHLSQLILKLMDQSGNAIHQGVWAQTASRLLKHSLQNSTPAYAELDITVDWRPLYELMKKVCLPEPGQVALLNPSAMANFRKNIALLITKARRYFSAEATAEILEELLPQLCPYDHSFFLAQHCLSLLLPTRDPAQVNLWLPEMMQKYKMVDNYHSSYLCWIKLFSRVARHGIGHVDLTAHLPDLYGDFLHALRLPVAGQSPRNQKHQGRENINFMLRSQRGPVDEICSNFAAIVVYTMYKGSPSLDLLEQVLATIDTFFHPSNAGAWTSALGTFLCVLSYYYVKRAGVEQGKQPHRSQPSYSEDLYLDLADERFARLLQKYATQGLFSKDERMVSSAANCLRDLAYVHPDLILPALLDESVPALETVDQSHRMLSTLKTLSLICTPMLNRQLYPRGGVHLEKLLWLTLPGIDATDPMKTARTLGWLEIVFYNVPLVDASASDEDKPASKALDLAETEQDDEVRTGTLAFREWSVEFIRKILKTLENMEDVGKGHISSMFMYMLAKIMRAFVQAASRPIYQACLKEVCDFVFGSCLPDAIKYFGIVMSAFGFGQPDLALQQLVQPMVAKLKKGFAEEMPESDLKWNTYLLSQVVKQAGGAREELLPYVDQLVEIAGIGRQHKDGKVAKYSNRVLRNTIRALVAVYPTERRCLSTQSWSEGKWAHWRSWGRYMELEGNDEDLRISWHVPSVKERAAVDRVVAAQLKAPLSVLEKAVGTKAEDDDKDALAALGVVEVVMRSCQDILGSLDGKLVSKPRSDAGPELTVATPKAHVMPALMVGKETLRTHLAGLFHKLNGTFRGLSEAGGHVKMVSKLIKMSDLTLSHFEVMRESKLFMRMRMIRYEHHFQKNFHTSKKCQLRPMLIDGAVGAFKRIQQWRGEEFSYNDQVHDLLTDLQHLILSDFAKVRSKSSKALVAALRRFPQALDTILERTIAVINEDKSTDKQVTGAVEFLTQEQIKVWSVNKYKRLRNLAVALCKSGGQHKDDKVQTLLHSLFLHTFSSLSRMPLSLSATTAAASSLVSAGQLAARQKAIAAANAQVAADYRGLVADLVAVVQSGPHWRYEMMTTAFLVALIRAEEPCPAAMATIIFDGLANELQPLRRICIAGANRLLQQVVMSSSPAAFEEESTQGEVEVKALLEAAFTTPNATKAGPPLAAMTDLIWTSGVYDAHNDGWSGHRLTAKKYPPQAATVATATTASAGGSGVLSEATRAMVGGALAKNIRGVVSALERNHITLSKDRDTSSGAKGAGDIIAEHVYHEPGREWPMERLSTVTKGFDHMHVQLLENMLRVYPELQGALVAELASLCKKVHEEEAQVTASELMAALLRGTRHQAWDQQSQLHASLLPLLEGALAGCQPDCLNHWIAGLHKASNNQDPRRMAWLSNVLATTAFPADGPSTTSDDASVSLVAKQVKFVQPFLIQGSWKSASLCAWYFEKIQSQDWLSHPYNQVRQRIGELLFILARNSGTWAGAGDAADPSLQAFLDYVTKRLSEFSFSSKDELTQEAAAEAKADKKEQHFIETVATWCTVCTSYDSANLERVHCALIPHMIKAQHHVDPQCAALAKYCVSTVSWIARLSQTALASMLKSCTELVDSSPAWDVKASALKFLQILVPRFSPKLTEAQTKRLVGLCERGMADLRVDVRTAAAGTLVSLVSSTPLSDVRRTKLIKRLVRSASTKLSKPPAPADMAKRHGGVLGLSAFVVSHPYDLPAYLPSILTRLVPHVDDPTDISKALRKVFADFKSTHKDQWESKFKALFEEEELDALESIEVAPSYFA